MDLNVLSIWIFTQIQDENCVTLASLLHCMMKLGHYTISHNVRVNNVKLFMGHSVYGNLWGCLAKGICFYGVCGGCLMKGVWWGCQGEDIFWWCLVGVSCGSFWWRVSCGNVLWRVTGIRFLENHLTWPCLFRDENTQMEQPRQFSPMAARRRSIHPAVFEWRTKKAMW